MNKKEIEQLKELIEQEEKKYDFNDYICNYLDIAELENIEDENELRAYFEELDEDNDITRADIIYYSTAIKVLQEHDPSLRDSLELAEEFGYNIDSLNSELLASLLISDLNKTDYWKFIESTINYFNTEVE